jgi:hypothetical protein
MAKKDKLQELFVVKGKDVDNIDTTKLIAELSEQESIENINEEADEQPVDINALFQKLDIDKTNKRMSAAQHGTSSSRSGQYDKQNNKRVRGLVNEDYLQNLIEHAVDSALEKNIDRIITGVANIITMMQAENNNTNEE